MNAVKKMFAIAAFAGIITATGACATDGTPVAATETVTPVAADTSNGLTYDETKLITVLDMEGIDYPSEASIIETAQKICRNLDMGVSLGGIYNALNQGTWTMGEIGYITGAAIGSFCPWNETLIP